MSYIMAMPSNIEHRKNIIISRRQKHKRMAIDYKGGSCQNCGYNKTTTALCFHHIDPATKSFAISQGGLEREWKNIQLELDKCLLLCQNCHREHHSNEKILEGNLSLKRLSNVKFKKHPYKNWSVEQKELSSVLSTRRKRNKKNLLVQKMGGACYICGYNKCNAALDFHHKDPGEKDFSISKAFRKGAAEINEELTKCILLCANCHSEDHHANFEQKRLQAEGELLEYRKNLLTRKLEIRTEISCSTCSKKIVILKSKLGKNNFCSKECCIEFKYSGAVESGLVEPEKVKRKHLKPNMEELKVLLWKMPTVRIAERYGVSDKAVEKWAKKFGLSKPGRGYWAKKEAGK